MATEKPVEFHTLEDADLVNRWVKAHKSIAELEERAGRIEMELTQRMEARGATAIEHPLYDVRLKEGPPAWDYAVLAGLREITEPAQLEGAYSPEHEETRVVPEKWNMVKAKALAKFGLAHKGILERARIAGTHRLHIRQITAN